MQPLFHARDAGVPHLHLPRIVPSALPSALFAAEQIFTRSNHVVNDNTKQITAQEVDPCLHQSTTETCIRWLRPQSWNDHTPYSQMAAPPRGFAMPANHSPAITKGGTKGGVWDLTNKTTKGWNTSYQDHRCPCDNDYTKSNGTKAVKEDKVNALTLDMQQHPR